MTDRLRWYRNRLAAMSAAEILHRIREAARRKLDAAHAGRLAAVPEDDVPLPEIPGLRSALDAWLAPPALLDQWQEDARRAQAGEHEIFGRRWPQTERAKIWHLDPVSGESWPRNRFCFAIDYRHGAGDGAGGGDIKYVWELNRLQYLQPVAALARKRGDAKLAAFCLGEIESWIDNNPPFLGVNWNSGIELALRIISIVTVASFVGDKATQAQRAKIGASLHSHAHWIARYPSLYSSANNHRAAEGLGLFAVGALCTQFPEAAAWKKTGWAVLCDAAQRQILPDGAGAEQAAAYAASVLETLLAGLKIARGCNHPVPDFYLRKITLGGEYLRWLCDGGNRLPAIGDDDNACVFGAYHSGDAYAAGVLACVAAATGRADLAPPRAVPHLRQLLFGAAPLPDFPPCGARCFPHGGMSVGRHILPRGDVMLAFDHGPLGYLSIAAHGHADALALWLHIGDQPVFVDAGTYLYHAARDERAAFRATAAHNTLNIAGESSGAMSGNFNWSRKADTVLRRFVSEGGSWQVEAEHDGYLQHFHVLHRRALSVSPASGAVIEDWLAGSAAQQVEIAFLLHPDLNARREDAEILILKGEQLLLRVRHESMLEVKIGQGWHSPAFGVKQAATRLSFGGMLPPEQKAVTHLFWSF